jgi:hypothetical protein
LVLVVGAVHFSVALPVGGGFDPDPDPEEPEPDEPDPDVPEPGGAEETPAPELDALETAEELELEPPPHPERTRATTVKPQKAFKNFIDDLPCLHGTSVRARHARLAGAAGKQANRSGS